MCVLIVAVRITATVEAAQLAAVLALDALESANWTPRERKLVGGGAMSEGHELDMPREMRYNAANEQYTLMGARGGARA